jgi:hypothetical protein
VSETLVLMCGTQSPLTSVGSAGYRAKKGLKALIEFYRWRRGLGLVNVILHISRFVAFAPLLRGRVIAAVVVQ